jgi:hypothetical protein
VSIVILFATGVINDLISGGVSTPLSATGQMVVPGSTSDNGILTLSLRNSQAKAITGITVTCSSSFSTTTGCVTMTYQNNPIPPSVPPNGATVGSASISSAGGPFVAGDTYSILMAVNFSGGSEITVDVSVTAIS